ncbi:thioredoxin domain-containing protein [Halothiobacillus sp. DCM-1]|uniref:thioredoxin domain-containing protein n=1 Tax=Halothiobacillus sp. DCM-1 TaxID=3112558 RepID=UPI00324468EC
MNRAWVSALIVSIGLGLFDLALAREQPMATPMASVKLSATPPAVAWPVLPPALQSQLHALVQAEAARQPDWHTRWLNAQQLPWFTNRLALSPSPYLRQHAHNPINWYPYDAEALAAAKAEHKLLFISVGYASCHWCHVMARESFESPTVARFLNEHFIAIKVDRQQQPALDDRYQLVVAMLNQGRSGWPANILALPDGRPFAAHLYQPKAELLDTLRSAQQAWQAPAAVTAQAEQLTQRLQRALDQRAAATVLDDAVFAQATRQLMQQMDPLAGGFGDGAKFPDAARLNFLLDQYARANLPEDQKNALRALLTRTLDAMADGGLYDQIGGGFFRYSTTPDWQSPHFEKMAYDQALLSLVYLRAALVLGDPHYAEIARDTLDFVCQALAVGKAQGFAAAISAESRPSHRPGVMPEEGAFYLWSDAQLAAALSPSERELARQYWQLSPTEGAPLPRALSPNQQLRLAQARHESLSALQAQIHDIRHKLQQARTQRPAPARDTNRILGWNALLIQALATAGRQLNEPRYLEVARNTAQFIDQHLRLPDGQWAHAFNQGQASEAANLSDRANLGLAWIALYDATGERVWLERALAEAESIQKGFAAPGGGYFDQPVNAGGAGRFHLSLRPFADGQEPAGNVSALRLWSALAERMNVPEAASVIEQIQAGFSGLIVQAPDEAVDFLDAVGDDREGAVDSLRYLAEGAVRLRLIRTGTERAEVALHFAPGWHSNAHEPASAAGSGAEPARAEAPLVPTTVQVLPPADSTAIDYPAGVRKMLAFAQTPLNLYTGDVRIGLKFMAATPQATRVRVKLQTCSTELCRLPESPVLWLPPGGFPLGGSDCRAPSCSCGAPSRALNAGWSAPRGVYAAGSNTAIDSMCAVCGNMFITPAAVSR